MTKLLVISDLHAYTPTTDRGYAPSFLVNSKSEKNGSPINPLSSIPELLASEGLEVDWILCPGDIADRADPDAQAFAWAELCKIKVAVGADLILATTGNHDVDSRLKHSDYDPKGSLQSLSPPFPGLSDAEADRFWARNYVIVKRRGLRLVNLNSSAFHGYHSDDNKTTVEYLNGRVSGRTIENLLKDLAPESFATNILFTHHHLVRNEEIYERDYSEMQLGGKLLSELCKATSSNWLVIHGHQHYPLLKYGAGTAHQPVIFSAGSVTASLTGPLSTEAANQFYHITLETDPSKTSGWAPCGVVRAWHWAHRRRWERSPSSFNIPYGTGFGFRDTTANVATEIARIFQLAAKPVLYLYEVFERSPHLEYLVKPAYDEVFTLLRSHGLTCIRAEDIRESHLRAT